MSQHYVGFLGGESGHRNFFGGTASNTRVYGLLACFLVLVILTPSMGLWGLIIAGGSAAVVFLITQRTHRGTPLERSQRRRRWKLRQQRGTHRFLPYDEAQWSQMTEELYELRKARGPEAGKRRAQLGADLVAMRAVPDGADGMGWLVSAREHPGIAWHEPVGEQPYLSVAFMVTGPLQGIRSGEAVDQVAERFSAFLASRASAKQLGTGVQIVTRRLPVDTALQEGWIAGQLDPEAFEAAVLSYDEAMQRTGQGAQNQRHIGVISWPLTPTFIDLARRYASGREGWRKLMAVEIESAAASLASVGFGPLAPLTARGVAAVIMNQQNPDWPMDAARDLDPTNFGLPSRDEFSAHVVDGHAFDSGAPVQWWHRTAVLLAENMAIPGRGPLWLLDVLRGDDLSGVLSVSFHINTLPASEGRARARLDATKDLAAAGDNEARGRLADDEVTTRAEASKRRKADLAPGSGHEGAEWVGYITVSAENRDELARACRELAAVCASGPGIDRLVWLDSNQAAASGTTWPIGRGIRPATVDAISKLSRRFAGRAEKDEIV